MQAGGSASLVLEDHVLDLTFSYPQSLAMVLPSQTIVPPSIDALSGLLQHAIRAAMLQRLVTILRAACSSLPGWQVKPLPERIVGTTRALAHRLQEGQVAEFVYVTLVRFRKRLLSVLAAH
jgi:hypothetical protein